ncbi:MAG: trypsin-like peptidase domain-containing protein, partial [Anaerolineales bacterium]|nr:trypsin-like peptidase domain-containing protein [Anaerolineales bacterium]
MSHRRILYILFVVIVAGISGLSGVVAGSMAVYRALSNASTDEANPAFVVDEPLITKTIVQLSTTTYETTIVQADEKTGPAVVTVVGVNQVKQSVSGQIEDQPVGGSGFFISEEGYVITNNHVVDNARRLSVILANGTELPATLIGTEKYADLAVLKIDGEVPAVANLGNSDGLKPGETVIAIGSPLGDFKNTVTVGVVSATGRMIDTGQGYEIEGLIQTDAAINSGNSGGPLINLAGEVIGINTLIIRGSILGSAPAEGLGFAIPSNLARIIAEQIIHQGYFSRPYLGIHMQSITPNIAEAYDFPVEWGVYVTEVEPNSPAGRSNLQPGDIITKIGDIALDEEHTFVNALFAFQPGETVTIEILRGDSAIQIQV